MSWRQVAQAAIAPIEAEYKQKSYGDLKRALFDAYTFYERANYPYKIWCDEQNKALARHPESPKNTTDGLPLFDAQHTEAEHEI